MFGKYIDIEGTEEVDLETKFYELITFLKDLRIDIQESRNFDYVTYVEELIENATACEKALTSDSSISSGSSVTVDNYYDLIKKLQSYYRSLQSSAYHCRPSAHREADWLENKFVQAFEDDLKLIPSNIYSESDNDSDNEIE